MQAISIKKLALSAVEYESSGSINLKNFKFSKTVEALLDLDDDRLIRSYNEYTGYNNFIQNTDEELDLCFASPAEAIRAAKFGNYNYMDDYFQYDGYGNLKSFKTSQVRNEILLDDDFVFYMYDHAYDWDDSGMLEFIAENEEEIEETALQMVRQGC